MLITRKCLRCGKRFESDLDDHSNICSVCGNRKEEKDESGKSGSEVRKMVRTRLPG